MSVTMIQIPVAMAAAVVAEAAATVMAAKVAAAAVEVAETTVGAINPMVIPPALHQRHRLARIRARSICVCSCVRAG